MNYTDDARAVCPFYQYSDRRSVTCEWQDGTRLRVLLGQERKRVFQARNCNRFDRECDCPIRAAMQRYYQNEPEDRSAPAARRGREAPAAAQP